MNKTTFEKFCIEANLEPQAAVDIINSAKDPSDFVTIVKEKLNISLTNMQSLDIYMSVPDCDIYYADGGVRMFKIRKRG